MIAENIKCYSDKGDYMADSDHLKEIHVFCSDINVNGFRQQVTSVPASDDTVTLYHGSKSGLHGPIAPISRDRCDFGKGFYMGTERMHPLTLICNYPACRLYTLQANLAGLRILNVEVCLDWALLIAYNRGKLNLVKGSRIYQHYASMASGCDMIIGYIANDRMFIVLDRFFNGEITDFALINSLSALKLGKQYVALTQKACNQIRILDEQEISDKEREDLKIKSSMNRSAGIALTDEICRKYRREGRFFDEILKAGE